MLWIIIGLLSGTWIGFAEDVSSDIVTAQVIISKQQVKAGESCEYAIILRHQEGWHTYSNYGGDVGLPTEVSWSFAEGLTAEASELSWPVPEKVSNEFGTSYVYKGTVALKGSISIAEQVKNGEYTCPVSVNWVACHEACIPGSQETTVLIKVGDKNIPNNQWNTVIAENQYQWETAPQESEGGWKGLILAFILAFIGGLALNAMPCVLPVLSLKLMSFVKQAQDKNTHPGLYGVAFTLGVLVSFWALSGTLLLLRNAGEHIGWGFQMQDERFVLALIMVLFVFGLNMFGLFEIGTSLTGISTAKATKTKSAFMSSFLGGMFATLMATPCTAPFMGTALGYALSQKAIVAMAIFTVLGLGLSSPYLVLSAFPSLLKWVPKPGSWMNTFKQMMGFLIVLSSIWILFQVAAVVSAQYMLIIMFWMWVWAIVAYCYGKFGNLGAKKWKRRVWLGVFIVSLIGGYKTLVEGYSTFQVETQQSKDWESYSQEQVQAYLEQGHPVFINCTAAWCATCQANKWGVFKKKEVLAAFKKHNVKLMEADWTKKDPKISQLLTKYNKAGVPFYILYIPNKEEVLFPEIVTKKMIIEGLENNIVIKKS